jgi:hypothetical protein
MFVSFSIVDGNVIREAHANDPEPTAFSFQVQYAKMLAGPILG